MFISRILIIIAAAIFTSAYSLTVIVLYGRQLGLDPELWLKINRLFADIVVHLVPIILAGSFGVIGAAAKTILGRSSEDIATITTRKRFLSLKEKELIGRKDYIKYQSLIETEKNNIALGAIFGIIGYFILSSKFIIRLLYPEIQLAETDVTFVGIAIIGIGFGYFAREFAGASTEAVEKRLLASLRKTDDEPKK